MLCLVAFLSLSQGCRALVIVPERQSAPQEADTAWVRVAACWAAAPLAEELSRSYLSATRRAATDVVACEGQLAEEMIADGKVDLAIVERPLAEVPRTSTREATLARDALAIVVHPDLPLHQISYEDLASLYAGRTVDWSMLGAGTGQPEVLSRAEGSFARGLFDSAVMNGMALSSAALLMPHDEAVVSYIATHPLAIGYASRAVVDSRVKVISLSNLLPSDNTIAQGRYPLAYRLVLLVQADAPTHVREWVAFAVGARGKRVVGARYILP